jgi:hypothetical protein
MCKVGHQFFGKAKGGTIFWVRQKEGKAYFGGPFWKFYPPPPIVHLFARVHLFSEIFIAKTVPRKGLWLIWQTTAI